MFQVSLPVALDTAQAVKLGRALAPLRKQGVMIAGSGSMTHNLHEFRQSGTKPQAYAREFSAWVRTAVVANAVDSLVNCRALALHAKRAHPNQEHFLPLLVALGAQADNDALQLLEGGITRGVLSMESYAWRNAAAAPRCGKSIVNQEEVSEPGTRPNQAVQIYGLSRAATSRPSSITAIA